MYDVVVTNKNNELVGLSGPAQSMSECNSGAGSLIIQRHVGIHQRNVCIHRRLVFLVARFVGPHCISYASVSISCSYSTTTSKLAARGNGFSSRQQTVSNLRPLPSLFPGKRLRSSAGVPNCLKLKPQALSYGMSLMTILTRLLRSQVPIHLNRQNVQILIEGCRFLPTRKRCKRRFYQVRDKCQTLLGETRLGANPPQ